MPDMDGYELYWRIKDYDEQLPVIMMTGFGYDPNHVLVRSKQDGLKDVLLKPFETSKLVDLIEKRLL
jgi:FixJ family two-component response regulator